MDKQIYIDHQFDRLTQNVGPLGLLKLAERLQNSVKNKLAAVNIVIYRFTRAHPDSRPGEFTLGSTFKSALHLEEGAPLISALDQIPDGERGDAIITSCLYRYPGFGLVNVAPNTPVKTESVTDYRGAEHPQYYDIYLQVGGDAEKAAKNLGSVRVTVKFAIKRPNQALHGGPRVSRHIDQNLKDGETLGNALDRAKLQLEKEEGSPMVVTNTLVKKETGNQRVLLKTHAIVGQYYTIAVDVEKKDFANSKLATVAVHVTQEKNGKWESSSDITVRLEEGKKLSEALSFLDEWENAVLSPHQGGSDLANPLFFLVIDKTRQVVVLAKPDNLVQGSANYYIQVTLNDVEEG